MQVIRAEAMGMCFGVRDAIAATEQVAKPGDYTIHGELVHNEQVNQYLKQRGFGISGEVNRDVPDTPGVLITAHGVSHAELQRLQSAGKTIINTTCPLVQRAHDAAVHADQNGWHVIVAGKRNHVEVLGLTGDLRNFTIIESPSDVQALSYPRLAIICQTTLTPGAAQAILDAVRRINPDSQVKLIDTICRPTKDRQSAMQNLLQRSDAIVVVGGAQSNNTRQLVRAAESANKPVLHVTCAEEVDIRWVSQFRVIGLTAGTSTPDSVINAVHKLLFLIMPCATPPSAFRASMTTEAAHV